MTTAFAALSGALIRSLNVFASALIIPSQKNPFENAQPHPYFDYEKKVFTKDGREEYMKEQEKLKK